MYQETGWTPCHVIAKDKTESILGVIPLYLKRLSSALLSIQQSFFIVSSWCQNVLFNTFIFCLISFIWICSHSYGEFVFDHSWADAYYSIGSRYYPKLQCCVPFTPVTGPRILIRNNTARDRVFEIMVSALKNLTAKVWNLD